MHGYALMYRQNAYTCSMIRVRNIDIILAQTTKMVLWHICACRRHSKYVLVLGMQNISRRSQLECWCADTPLTQIMSRIYARCTSTAQTLIPACRKQQSAGGRASLRLPALAAERAESLVYELDRSCQGSQERYLIQKPQNFFIVIEGTV